MWGRFFSRPFALERVPPKGLGRSRFCLWCQNCIRTWSLTRPRRLPSAAATARAAITTTAWAAVIAAIVATRAAIIAAAVVAGSDWGGFFEAEFDHRGFARQLDATLIIDQDDL